MVSEAFYIFGNFAFDLGERLTLLELKIGQQAVVVNKSIENLPLKLIEFGCLPGNSI